MATGGGGGGEEKEEDRVRSTGEGCGGGGEEEVVECSSDAYSVAAPQNTYTPSINHIPMNQLLQIRYNTQNIYTI